MLHEPGFEGYRFKAKLVDLNLIQGAVMILLVTSHYGNQAKGEVSTGF